MSTTFTYTMLNGILKLHAEDVIAMAALAFLKGSSLQFYQQFS
jgi:hypothetical protein